VVSERLVDYAPGKIEGRWVATGMEPGVDSGWEYRRNGKEEEGKAVIDGRSDEVERWVDRRTAGAAVAVAVADVEAVEEDNEEVNKDSGRTAGFERREAYCTPN
jgi:hypothetical protein